MSASMADFFPGGVVCFVAPPFDEWYWSHFGIPARIRTDLWGSEAARGLAYRDLGPQPTGVGAVRKFGGSRKARGYASGKP